jgi:transcriptional regulator with XRE-family HTH domain
MKPTITAIRRARIKANMTQLELASRAGVSPATLCILEKNGIKTVATAKRYAAALGPNVAPGDVMDW